MDPSNIQLVDNTAPAERPPDDVSFSRSNTNASTGSRLWSRPSIRAERAKRRYAKWQPERLGVSTSANDVLPESDGPSSSDEGALLRAGTNTNTLTNASTIQEGVSTINERDGGYQSDSQPLFEHPSDSAGEQIQQQDFGTGAGIGTSSGNAGYEAGYGSSSGSGAGTTHQSKNHPKICGLKPGSELDILYENQRGWFFFGIPLYSNQSLLSIDPAPWINASGKRSFVNITNAQVPDPSWDWAWKSWYVDMSGDVDEQGWQYAFSFSLSSSWHGTHPFWHSFVRRRRWVRLRTKRMSERERNRRSRTGMELAHNLNEDYFTIHSAVRRKRASGSETASRTTSLNLGEALAETQDEGLEDIRNVPALMYAIKAAIVDREKLDAVRKFVDDGGEELYYLDGKIPEIMSRLVYQTSQWQLLAYLNDATQSLSEQRQTPDDTESPKQELDTQSLRRKHEYLSRAAATAADHIAGPEVLQESPTGPEESQRRISVTPVEMPDLTTGNRRRDSLMSKVSSRYSFKPMDNGGEIKGIPREAEIGHDFHIW